MQGFMWFQVFQSNTDNLNTVVFFQVFLSNTNNLNAVVGFQVFLSNTNNLNAVVGFQVFLSNTNNFNAVIWFQVKFHIQDIVFAEITFLQWIQLAYSMHCRQNFENFLECPGIFLSFSVNFLITWQELETFTLFQKFLNIPFFF